jgi:hypothetical protein
MPVMVLSTTHVPAGVIDHLDRRTMRFCFSGRVGMA